MITNLLRAADYGARLARVVVAFPISVVIALSYAIIGAIVLPAMPFVMALRCWEQCCWPWELNERLKISGRINRRCAKNS